MANLTFILNAIHEALAVLILLQTSALMQNFLYEQQTEPCAEGAEDKRN